MAVSTTITNSELLHLYYVKKLLKTLQPRLQLYKLGRKTQLPKGMGVRAKWLVYNKIASSTAPLTEGVNPPEISFATVNITADVLQYGQHAKVSDLLETTAIDNTVENLAELFGKAGAETIEDLIVAELDSTLTVQRVNSRLTDDDILASDVVVLKEFLRGMINLKGSYTGPHEIGAYVAVLHPACEYDILSEVNPGGWLDLASYAKRGTGQDEVMQGEIGKCYGIRFMVSDKMPAVDNINSISVKRNFLIGEECFGVVELGQKSVDIIINPSNSGGAANPLHMFGTVGYKIKGFAVKTFNYSRGLVLRGATSFSPI